MSEAQTVPAVDQVLCSEIIDACDALMYAIVADDVVAYRAAVENAHRLNFGDEDVDMIYRACCKSYGIPSFPA